MNRIFDDFFARGSWPESRANLLDGEWSPSVDLAETDKDILVTAELPGVKQDDLDISITGNALTLKGAKKEEKKIKKENYHHVERSYGSFQCSISLPAGVQSDKAKATCRDGVLKVTIPKAEELKPKQIKLDTG
jgi:HSP20 family protein